MHYGDLNWKEVQKGGLYIYVYKVDSFGCTVQASTML